MNKKSFLDQNGLNYKVDKGILSALTLLTQLGLVMIASVLLWVLIVFYLKRLFFLHDLFLILGAVLGVATGFWADYHIIIQYFKKQDKMND